MSKEVGRSSTVARLGTATVVALASVTVLFFGALVGAIAVANHDAKAVLAAVAYVLYALGLPGVVAWREVRNGKPMATALRRGSVTCLLLHVVLIPVALAALAM